jgi:rod shape-determining protein MreD
VRSAGIGLTLVLALTVQTTLAWMAFSGAMTPNVVLVVVIWAALTFGPVVGMLAGTVGGLALDALSHEVLGVAGLSHTVAGYVAGLIGSQFIVVNPLPRFLVLFSMSLVNAACFFGVYAMIGETSFFSPWRPIVMQAALNAAIGLVVIWLIERATGAVNARDMARERLRRRYL